MVPLEMHGMIRACRPAMRSYYKSLYIEHFPYLLRQMITHCIRYRLRRRLWITTLDPLCQDLMEQVLHYLPIKYDSEPACFREFWALRYNSLSVSVRMSQIAGMLHALGYTPMSLSTPDYEYEAYRVLAEHTSYDIEPLYQSLKTKRIIDKWPVMYSYIYSHTCYLEWSKAEWKSYCGRERLTLYVNACIRTNALNPTEIQLVSEWVERMKYPSVGVDW